jgi:hypothetical protein
VDDKLNQYKQIIDEDDAHGVAILEQEARAAEEESADVSAGLYSLDEPSDSALAYDEGAHDRAVKAREAVNDALSGYDSDSQVAK